MQKNQLIYGLFIPIGSGFEGGPGAGVWAVLTVLVTEPAEPVLAVLPVVAVLPVLTVAVLVSPITGSPVARVPLAVGCHCVPFSEASATTFSACASVTFRAIVLSQR